MNYAQVSSLEAQGLLLETQMTYEEINEDGSVNVFRLLRVPVRKLVEVQARIFDQSQKEAQTLERARLQLLDVQNAVLAKQQELETKTRAMDESQKSLARTQTALNEKAFKIEQQQRDVEAVIHQLESRVGAEIKQQAKSQTPDMLVNRMKSIESQIEIRGKQLEEIHRRAEERIWQLFKEDRKRCRLLLPGMTQGEVKTIMGEPRSKAIPIFWEYGMPVIITVEFNDGYVWKIRHEWPGGRAEGCPSGHKD
jgi:hypothetical protein